MLFDVSLANDSLWHVASSLHLFFHPMFDNLVGKLLIQLSLLLIKYCGLMLASYCYLLDYFHQTVIKSTDHEDHKRQ